jgi:microcystin-dependent protein
MATPFLGEIKIISWNFPPKGWAFCNGQVLPINQNQALFALLGTMYGGDGRTTFALPNLQGRIPVHIGNGFTQGEAGGETAHTINISEMPAHSHVPAFGGAANSKTPAASMWTDWGKAIYAANPNAAMLATLLSNVGGSQPHENLSPYLVLNFIIALQGIFPTQN